MSISALKDALPEYAKDIKLNLSSLLDDESLSTQQKWGCFVACAMASRQDEVITAFLHEGRQNLSAEAFQAAQAAAAIMGMNNVYYRFVHLASNQDYHAMPAKLRMNILANPGVDKTDFELWSLAVSAVNGCGLCIDSHEKHLLAHGLTKDHVQTAVRIAAVISAIAAVWTTEKVLQANQTQSVRAEAA